MASATATAKAEIEDVRPRRRFRFGGSGFRSGEAFPQVLLVCLVAFAALLCARFLLFLGFGLIGHSFGGLVLHLTFCLFGIGHDGKVSL